MKFPLTARKTLYAIALAAYTLLFGEIFIRIANPQVLLPRYVTGTPWGIRGNIPHAHYWHWTPDVNVEFNINGQGMRADHDYADEKPAGTCRLALFGDSFFMGYELNLKDTFATRLEERLRDDHYNVDVLNFSVSGFGTAEMIRTYDSYARRFSPDLVVFEWHSTDLDDNVRSDLFQLKDGQLVDTGKTYLPGVKIQDTLMKFRVYQLVADNSHLYSFLRENTSNFLQKAIAGVRGKIFSRDSRARNEGTEAGDQALTPYAVKLAAALLQHARQTTHEDGGDFFVVEVPRRLARTSFNSSLAAFPAADLTGLNIVSPLAAFERMASPETTLYYEHGHWHLTPLAVNALVDVTAPRLEQSENLRACKADN